MACFDDDDAARLKVRRLAPGRTMPLSNHMQWLTITGDLGSSSFIPWVMKHSRRLGLSCEKAHADASRAVFKVEGQPDLIDALEVGCMLGPYDVWVETIERRPAGVSD